MLLLTFFQIVFLFFQIFKKRDYLRTLFTIGSQQCLLLIQQFCNVAGYIFEFIHDYIGLVAGYVIIYFPVQLFDVFLQFEPLFVFYIP